MYFETLDGRSPVILSKAPAPARVVTTPAVPQTPLPVFFPYALIETPTPRVTAEAISRPNGSFPNGMRGRIPIVTIPAAIPPTTM